MTILVTGASGLVGSACVRAAVRRGHRVIGIVGGFAGEVAGLERCLRVDLTDETATTRVVLEVFPQAILNGAAVSVPEQCEIDPARSQAMNVRLPEQLAQLAHHVGARLIHLSSEQVFDGTRDTPYSSTEPVAPLNLYGRQKVESERRVQAAAPDETVTLRVPLLMGDSPSGRRSMHERLFADWQAGKTPGLFEDEIRQTCTAESLAEVMVELAERNDLAGVHHWAGAEPASRYEMGLRIRERFRLSEAQAPIARVARAQVPELARKRQACLKLDCGWLAGRLKTRPQTLAQQVEELRVPEPSRAWYLGLG